MKILIVSGFLGAGKTTFIRELTRRTGRRMAILENEYAAANVDGGVLKSNLPPDKKVNIWELTEGCICCSMKGDFAASVLTIANAVNPEYLIVEPTGVGMLSSVAANLQQIEYERISLLAPVTIVDGNSLGRYLADYPEIFRDQITAAQTLIVSKFEQADAKQYRAVDTILRQMNPQAEIVLTHYSKMDEDWWNALLERGYGGERFPLKTGTPKQLPQTFTLKHVSLEEPEELILLLEELIRGRFGNVFRAKGAVRAGDVILGFDVSDGRYAITGSDLPEEEDGTAVFIGEHISRQEISHRFLHARAEEMTQRQRRLRDETQYAPKIIPFGKQ